MLRISTFNHLRYRISILFHSIGRVGPEQGDVLIVQVQDDASPTPDLQITTLFKKAILSQFFRADFTICSSILPT